MDCNSFLKYSPSSWERSGSLSSIMTSNAAMITEHASGLTPKVDPCDPASNTPRMSSLATTQKIGITPPPKLYLGLVRQVQYFPNHRQTFSRFVRVLLEFHPPYIERYFLSIHHKPVSKNLLQPY